MASLLFVASRGKSPQGDFAIDDLTWFEGKCEEREPFVTCKSSLRNPLHAGRPIGFWNCSDAYYLGSSCNLVCMSGYMVTAGMEPENHCHEEGLYGGWEQNPSEITCEKNYCSMPRPDLEGVWFFGCTDEKNQKRGIITENGSCELRCLPGYKRTTPQLIICMNGKWHQLKASTGQYTEKQVDINTIACEKIPDEKLSDYEKKKIEAFKPPTQLGSEEENKIESTTEAPLTTKKEKLTKMPDIVKTTEKTKFAEKNNSKIQNKETENHEKDEHQDHDDHHEHNHDTAEHDHDDHVHEEEQEKDSAPQADAPPAPTKPPASFATPPKFNEVTEADFMDIYTTQPDFDSTPQPEPEGNAGKKKKPVKKKPKSNSAYKSAASSILFFIIYLFYL